LFLQFYIYFLIPIVGKQIDTARKQRRSRRKEMARKIASKRIRITASKLPYKSQMYATLIFEEIF
jgi:hypothetical protein